MALFRRIIAAAAISRAAALAPASRQPLLQLLVQRTAQTQIYYLSNFHDEVTANWVAGFGSPDVTLKCERLSDRSVQPVFHGLDAYCFEEDETALDYYRKMMRAPPKAYTVAYLVGTPDGAAQAPAAPDGFQEASAASYGMWGSNPAAESRRRNPYLNRSKRYIEYDKTIVPSAMCAKLMRTREQLAVEWEADLRKLVVGEQRSEVPYVPKMDGDHSPLRRGNLDLVERLATRCAAVAAVGQVSPAEARYLKAQLAPEVEEEEPKQEPAEGGDSLAAELAARVCSLQRRGDALGDHCSSLKAARRWLDGLRCTEPFTTEAGSKVNPHALASKILSIRDEIVADWSAEIVADVKNEHLLLSREMLEAQLSSPSD